MKHHIRIALMAAAGTEPSVGGGQVVGTGVVPALDSDEFEAHYRAAKTGVPMNEAKDFANFLNSVIEGRFFGSKYAKKFCNEGVNNVSPQNVWIRSMTLAYVGGKRKATINLGEKGVKLCDTLYGLGNGPVPLKKNSAGQTVYTQREGTFIDAETTIKSST